MTHVAWRLTAKNRDQPGTLHSVIKYGLLLPVQSTKWRSYRDRWLCDVTSLCIQKSSVRTITFEPDYRCGRSLGSAWYCPSTATSESGNRPAATTIHVSSSATKVVCTHLRILCPDIKSIYAFLSVIFHYRNFFVSQSSLQTLKIFTKRPTKREKIILLVFSRRTH